ncbi:MAG: 1-(5-phosphoribosyl)-5-[(5-phosphoribosylamino)methylideneamino]imidazole-4-carboxamide isomerase [Phycisphaerae bacterium]|jgi:phosphoribosylformimino-5-aminoimidazole carboxamide ribotide isomerase|nr:1-(5-phosphoribosyl)-5-[(5-phosphoribosylamino)methylideneamino]imidazole-4-carboxamide isomerase [Phycisphaerae bacterium]HPC21346.1 1-(5-phosphoribosyl)-5-[(5-phosphoribosylamino)methylideneamino]imidazole-4-carboxamide isomerase [Phycisphaerae bacterium]HRS28366.1 1-(5-phosphoribosyl)-5-[(5-phosphoribosylamino)methylideneamino]imidazole-4-carboxamide isomerase [Phycisphaerae bacterium]HRT42141.1 1-(5-phosphoribosyl)-5-[(5-phosphoribosylamino)methylideneamino]imidazole-4-carboxamide isomera
MEILPAIDLLEGKCVRLVQGRYDRVIEYESDPLAIAGRFREAGAAWLHVIDLDGARSGHVANLDTLRRIILETGARVEFGGGVRDEATIRAALQAGAARVIIGTRALEDWEWFRTIVHTPEFSGRIALGLDARLGKLAVRGWTRDTAQTAIEVARQAADWPLATIVYTDIGRDGLLLGPNLEAIRLLAAESRIPVVASGGVTDLDDVRRLTALNLAGIVIGRAIYEQTLDLKEALQAAAAAN